MDTVLYGFINGCAYITLNRPEAYNAFNREQGLAFQKCLTQATHDPSVRAVVVTGSGKAFCSGQDLKEFQNPKPNLVAETITEIYNPIIKLMRNMPKPIICRLNGVAAGAGCSIALACDFIIASENAKLIEAFIGVGLVLDSGSSYFLPRLVGSARAFEYATLSTPITAAQALELGMINRVVAPEMLDQAVEQVSSTYAQSPTKAIGYIKQMLNSSYNSSLDQMLAHELHFQDLAGKTSDHAEGVTAFIEKRKPVFTGN